MDAIGYLKKNGIKRAVEVLWDYKVEIAFEKIILRFVKNKPLKDIIIIESHNDFDSSGGAFYDYLIKNAYNRKYKIVWFLRNTCPKNLPENVEGYRYDRPSIKRAYYHCVAKYIVCGHYYIETLRDGQKSYFTTHGAMALKNTKGRVTVPSGITYVLCPSDFLAPIQADLMLMPFPNNKQIMIGYPCYDVLYQSKRGDLSKITNQHYYKVIIWMPTFRKGQGDRNDSDRELSMGIPIIANEDEYEELNKKLVVSNILLIIKIHPMQDLSKIKVKSLSNIIVIDGNSVKELGVDNYRLMKDTDAMISDYSSSGIDYLHMDKPIAYTLDDKDDYKIGFIVDDPITLMAGHKLYNISDLYRFIENVSDGLDPYREERIKILDKFFKFHDGHNCERLARHMGI